jgi:hypothetical protein
MQCKHLVLRASVHSAPRTPQKMKSERLVRGNERKTVRAFIKHPVQQGWLAASAVAAAPPENAVATLAGDGRASWMGDMK